MTNTNRGIVFESYIDIHSNCLVYKIIIPSEKLRYGNFIKLKIIFWLIFSLFKRQEGK